MNRFFNKALISFFLKGMQDFSDDYIQLLQNSDLTNDNDRTACIQVATLLTQALGVQLQPGFYRFNRKR